MMEVYPDLANTPWRNKREMGVHTVLKMMLLLQIISVYKYPEGRPISTLKNNSLDTTELSECTHNTEVVNLRKRVIQVGIINSSKFEKLLSRTFLMYFRTVHLINASVFFLSIMASLRNNRLLYFVYSSRVTQIVPSNAVLQGIIMTIITLEYYSIILNSIKFIFDTFIS